MRFPYSVPNIDVVENGEFLTAITSVQDLDEYEDRVVLKCAEFVEQFKRGFICDFIYRYIIVDQDVMNKEEQTDVNKDLLLVYINKSWESDGIPQFEYIFYK